MEVNHINYKEETFSCSCGFKGLGKDCRQGEMFDVLFEIDCPDCKNQIGVIMFATFDYIEKHQDKADESDLLQTKLARQNQGEKNP